MSRIFITGSSTGLGLMTASLLAEEGHEVVLHARNDERAKSAMNALPAAHTVVEGDVSTIRATRQLAEKANQHGPYDAVIHNVGIGYREPQRIETGDGLPHVFAINTLAPFILTALMKRPKRLVYLSSGLHRSASSDLENIILSPVDSKVEIDVRGDLAGILTLSVQTKNPAGGAGSSQAKMVAGA